MRRPAVRRPTRDTPTRLVLAAAMAIAPSWPAATGAAPPPPSASPPPRLAVGDTVPALGVIGLDGAEKRISFPEKGATVLLFFMSSCPTCHRMIPEWNRAFERRPPSVQVVGVLLDREPPGFFMATSISFPVVRPASRDSVRTQYRVNHVPLTLRLGAGGQVQDLAQGQIDGIRLGELFRP